MLLTRLMHLAPGILILLMVATEASADAITSCDAKDCRRLLSAAELVRSDRAVTDPLSLSSAWKQIEPQSSPLLRRARDGGLADSALGTGEGCTSATGEVGRPSLPGATLAGTSARRLAPIAPYREPEIASDPRSGHNVRIPEPASLTLVAAGLIGLIARGRMRRAVQARKVETRRVD